MIPDFKIIFDNGGRTSKQTNKSYCLVVWREYLPMRAGKKDSKKDFVL